MPATAPISCTRGTVSLQRMIDLPGPRAFRTTPVTSTEKASGLVPWNTVHTSPFWPALMSDRGITSPVTGWARAAVAAAARRQSVRSVRPIVRFPNLCTSVGICEVSEVPDDRIHHLARPVDRGAPVRRADERRLVGARGKVHAGVKAAVEEAREELRVARAGLRGGPHGRRREEEAEHGARLGH